MVKAGPVRRVVAAFAVACVLAAFAAPRSEALTTGVPAEVVGPEHPVSAPVEGPSAGFANVGDVAFDGTNHLVVWADSRANGYDVYGARVSPQGVVLDPGGIRIASGAGDQVSPKVSYGGEFFLVVWTSNSYGSAYDVQGARVSPAGTLLDPSPIAIAVTEGDQYNPDVTYGAGTYLVVWEDLQYSTQQLNVYGARVSPSGVVADVPAIPISTARQAQSRPRAAFGGGTFLVVWADHQADPMAADVMAARVDRTGRVLDPAGLPIRTGPADETSPDLAFNGTHYLVVWLEADPAGSAVVGARVAPTGSVLDPSGIAVSDPADPASPDMSATVTAAGSTFLVAWSTVRPGEGYDGVASRIDGSGTNLDPAGFVVTTTGGAPAPVVGADLSGYFAAWDDGRYGIPQVFGSGIDPDGSVRGPGLLISRAANRQTDSAVAFDGTNHLVVWVDRRNATNQVVATRMSPSGRRLDLVDIPVSQGQFGSNPSVAFDGENFVVAWMGTGAGALVTRVSPLGRVLNVPIVVGEPFPSHFLTEVSVAANETGALVVTSEEGHGSQAIRAVRVRWDDPDPDLLPVVVSYGGYGGSVASDGHDYLVAWAGYGVAAARVDADGTLLDDPAVQIWLGSTSRRTAVAWNGQRYLVVWGATPGGPDFDVLGARLAADGTVQDTVAIPIATGSPYQDDPAVAANGPFLVAWRESDGAEHNDVRGTRIGDNGTVLDRPALTIAASRDTEWLPAVAPGAGTTWAVSYQRFVQESPYGATRVFVRTITPK